MKKLQFALALVTLLLLSSIGDAAPPHYVKCDTWPETIRQSLAAMLQADPAALEPAATAPAGVKLGGWRIAGPFSLERGAKPAFDHAFAPEQAINEGKNADKVKWQSQNFADGAVHALKAGSNGSTYLHRVITADRDMTITGYFGSDDGMKAWLNGAQIISRDAARGAGPNQEKAELALKAGENHLLLKIYNRTGDHGFYFSLSPSPAAADPALQRITDLWNAVSADFTAGEAHQQMSWERRDGIWSDPQSVNDLKGLARRYANRTTVPQFAEQAKAAAAAVASPADLAAVRDLYYKSCRLSDALSRAGNFSAESLRMSIEDLITTYGDRYPKGKAYLQRLAELEKRSADGDAAVMIEMLALQAEALLANPGIDFDRLLLVKRDADPKKKLGLPQNWQGNTSISPNVANEIATMSIRDPLAPLQTLYKPENDVYVGEVDLHFDAGKMLFSSIGSHNRWQIFELNVDGTGLRQVTKGEYPDIDSYDPMYLPDGRIIFVCNSGYHGVPCVSGSDYVGNLHIMNADGTGVRRLCFDQDLNWHPTMLHDGRVMFLRWEYTDSAHYFSRILMHMNPDGTGQMEYYGSNSYWPNSLFFARPLPSSPTKFVGIVSGHHGVPRMGEMVVFDVAKGRKDATGVVQRIPGHGEPVEPIIQDALVNGSWPKFLHPFPITDKHFLVACQPDAKSLWGIYLVDIYDNMVLLKEDPGFGLLEPVPLRKTPKPPVIADKVKLGDKTATTYIHDIYTPGGLLDGVPRGSVKSLRLYQYEYSYRNMGGHYVVGIEGPWDIRRIIGTVPVFDDGSAVFKIPANTAVALQPLDEQGKAVQLMRTWFVGMPGEVVSCVGCHERQSSASTLKLAKAARVVPMDPTPWHGPKRGFSFLREVQPVLDKHCVGCHNGEKPERPNFQDIAFTSIKGMGHFPNSYIALHPWVRRNGPEGDWTGLVPLEFHADTSQLVQMLSRGHHGVKLDAEAWDRLITWIDLNVPCHGTWHEAAAIKDNYKERRLEMAKAYSNVDEDIEKIAPLPERPEFIKPEKPADRPEAMKLDGWPLDADKARQMQASLGETEMTIDLGDAGKLVLRRVPAGEFVMGCVKGYPDEFPRARVRIDKSFWVATTEITLAQYQQFDSSHRNGYYDMHYKDQVRPGYLMDEPNLPVIRVSQEQAMAFCRWLSNKTGRKFTLPTEAQWEWAARAGTATPFYYGGMDTDFAPFANLADAQLTKMAVSGVDPQPINGEKFGPDFKYWDYMPKDARFDDGTLHLAPVGKYQPNAWGLHDMIGNVVEWTRSPYRPYPYSEAEPAGGDVKYVVRGGSWEQRPKDSRVTWRWGYAPWQRVYNVGIRVICEE